MNVIQPPARPVQSARSLCSLVRASVVLCPPFRFLFPSSSLSWQTMGRGGEGRRTERSEFQRKHLPSNRLIAA